MYRKYVMTFRYWLIDLDVTVEVFMDYELDVLIPSYIHYDGYWDIREVNQSMLSSNFGIIVLKLSNKKS